MIRFEIPIAPITKKNHQQIVWVKGRPMVLPSAQYRKYEKACEPYIPTEWRVDTRCNVEAVFYMPTRRRVDLVNLQEALLDILVKYGLLADDNCNIVASMNGSRVEYDKENPRTEVVICQTEIS